MLCTDLLSFSESPTGSFITETMSRTSAHEWTERQPPNVSHIVFAGERHRGWQKGLWKPWHFDFDIGQAGSFVQGADHTRETGSEKRKAALRPRAAPSQAGEATGKEGAVRESYPNSWCLCFDWKKEYGYCFTSVPHPPYHDQTATMRGSQKDMGKDVLGKII